MFLDPRPMNTPRNRLTAAIRRTTRPTTRDLATIFLEQEKETSCHILPILLTMVLAGAD